MNEKRSSWDRLMRKPEEKPSSFDAIKKCVCSYRDKHFWVEKTSERDECAICGQVRLK